MSYFIGRNREARQTYGFDEVALVPGNIGVDPEDTDISFSIGDVKFKMPFLASAMDGVVNVKFAIAMNKLGGLAVLNLDGINTRYENPEEAVDLIVNSEPGKSTEVFQKLYKEPVKPKLIAKRVEEIKKAKVPCAVSCIPQNAADFGPIAKEAGCDIFIAQATVITTKFESTRQKTLDIAKFVKEMKIPVVVGNCVTYRVALELIDTGVAGLLVGVGPGAACTTRGVLGIGVPQATAIADVQAARANRDSARRGVEKCTVTAPFNGIVRGRSAQLGELAAPGTPLLTLADTSELQVVAQVQARDAEGLAAAANGNTQRHKEISHFPGVYAHQFSQGAFYLRLSPGNSLQYRIGF